MTDKTRYAKSDWQTIMATDRTAISRARRDAAEDAKGVPTLSPGDELALDHSIAAKAWQVRQQWTLADRIARAAWTYARLEFARMQN